MVFPTRLVFDKRTRMAEVNLINPADSPGSYRLSLVALEMDSEGAFKEVPLPRALKELVRISHRVVTLAPKEGQTVRVELRKPGNLPTGEYRLHLLFHQELPPAPEPSSDEALIAANQMSMSVRISIGFSIPIIIRQGETSAKVALTALTLAADKQSLKLRLERTGNASAYGHFKVTFQPLSGKPVLVALAKGIAVYLPNPFRDFTLPLNPAIPLGAGQLLVTYCAPAEDGGALLADCSLELP